MYASIVVQKVGDKLLIVIMGMLIKNKLPKRPEVAEDQKPKFDPKKLFEEKIWPLIPKYSDLQKKSE
jgi:hypothetical protein